MLGADGMLPPCENGGDDVLVDAGSTSLGPHENAVNAISSSDTLRGQRRVGPVAVRW